MRIALYGMPSAGKTFVLDKIDFIDCYSGSSLLKMLAPNFEQYDDNMKESIRKKLANELKEKDNFIIDGHYKFGDKTAFTENDGLLYDVFIYLYISPDVLCDRMKNSDKNKKYLKYDIEKWQEEEMYELRKYCHDNDKDFYIIDNPDTNVIDDVSEIIDFIREIINGYSCVSYAKKCAKEIIQNTSDTIITLVDGDKTIIEEDSSAFINYKTNIFNNNFYSGYQFWRQKNEMSKFAFCNFESISITENVYVLSHLTKESYIISSGNPILWGYISEKLGLLCFCSSMMSSDTKFFISKFLQQFGKYVVAYGDSMNDYYMLKKADNGILVTHKGKKISKSLINKNLEGITVV